MRRARRVVAGARGSPARDPGQPVPDRRSALADPSRRLPDRSQPVPDRPEIREVRPEERRSQVLDTRRATGARFRADRPLDHLDVAIPPLLEPLVQIDEPFRDERGIGVAAVDVYDDLLDTLVRLDRE